MSLLPEGVNVRRIRLGTLFVVVALHVLAIAAPFYFTWSGVVALLVMYWVTGALGVTLCYHRLLTHRSYLDHHDDVRSARGTE